MRHMLAAILVLASVTPAFALPKALLLTDSVYYQGFPSETCAGVYISAERADYTWTLDMVPGRPSNVTGTLATHLAANDFAIVVIALGTNDPNSLGHRSAAETMNNLDTLCGMAEADGAQCVLLTPMHAPLYTTSTFINRQDFHVALREWIMGGSWFWIDAHSSIPLAEWLGCTDSYLTHPNTNACRRKIADYVAPRLP